MLWLIWIVLVMMLIRVYNKVMSGWCRCDTVMTGKVVVVTGASGGIGYATALDLARRGAKVIIACRDDERGFRTVEKIIRETGNNQIRYIHLDLSSFDSIRKFVYTYKSTEAKLDVLINNAGVINPNRDTTGDGLMKDMQVNHYGPFLLTTLLVPMLRASAPSRVVIVSSALHKFGVVEVDSNKGCYFQSYANSKLYNVLFSNELSRRLSGCGVTVNAVNPGQVNTSLYRSSTLVEKLKSLVLYTFFKNPEEGSQTSIYVAVSEECDYTTGGYYEDCRTCSTSSKANDVELAKEIWKLSEDLVKLKPDERI